MGIITLYISYTQSSTLMELINSNYSALNGSVTLFSDSEIIEMELMLSSCLSVRK